MPTPAAQNLIDELMRGLTARTPGARLEVLGGRQRPPMEPTTSAELFALAARFAAELREEPLRGVAVGGASDGNYTAAVGCPTLDGLGAVGAGAHADSEYVDIARMVPRARLLARPHDKLSALTGSLRHEAEALHEHADFPVPRSRRQTGFP